MKISIHSPYTGRDENTRDSIGHEGISIHSPYTGRDFYGQLHFAHHSGISIHSPYTGSDAPINVWCKKMEDFNPLSLYRERLCPLCISCDQVRFQSTLPIQGETAILHIKLLIYSQSLMQNAKQKNFFQHLHNKL